MRHHLKKYRRHIWVLFSLGSVFFLLSVLFILWKASYTNRIYPNIYLADLALGGKTPDEAQKILNNKEEAILEQGFIVAARDQNIKFNLREYATADPDLSRDLIKFNNSLTIDKLYSFGRRPRRGSIKDIFLLFVRRKEFGAELEFNEKEFLTYLKEKLKKFEEPARDAAFIFDQENVEIKEEFYGSKINYENLLKKLKLQMFALRPPYVLAEFIKDIPKIKKQDLALHQTDFVQILSRAPFVLQYKNEKWTITREMLKDYLSLEKEGGELIFTISRDKSEEFFKKISEKINIPAQNAKFKIEDGRVVEFQASQLGAEINIDATAAALNSVLANGYPAINIIVLNKPPDVTTGDANNLGITDLLGRGATDFRGSPANRIHNIKNGASILNGLLIKTGEDFSLLRALGKIDKESGFKEELVIKQDRTVPEFGGGLCQIGTTVFRAIVDSGLPVLERRNHSYRVIYYEPAGFDATIYNPSPDLKFKNDTSGLILIQTKVLGTKLVIEFWGKRDGREVSYTKPVLYNLVKSPAPKFIPTPALEPGKKKKIESAHDGADAYFKYTVRYSDDRGEVSKTFYSRYKPWGEVWLVGATSTTSEVSLVE